MNTVKKPEIKATATVWFLINCGKRGGSPEGLIEATRWTEDECKSAAISLDLGHDYETGVGDYGSKEMKFEYFDGVEAISLIVKNVYEDEEGEIRFDGDEHITFDAIKAHTYPELAALEAIEAYIRLAAKDLGSFIDKQAGKYPKGDTESAVLSVRRNLEFHALAIKAVREDYSHE